MAPRTRTATRTTTTAPADAGDQAATDEAAAAAPAEAPTFETGHMVTDATPAPPAPGEDPAPPRIGVVVGESEVEGFPTPVYRVAWLDTEDVAASDLASAE